MRWWEYWSWELFLTRIAIVLLSSIAIGEIYILASLIYKSINF